MTDNKIISTETFEDFKKSFSYGSRTDLSFKFLAGLSDNEAAKFFQDLLWKLVDSIDDGDYSRLIEHMVAGQVQSYSKPSKWTYDDAPFAHLSKPLAESRLALLTSTGHYIEGEDPEPFGVKNMTQVEATRRISEFLKAEPTLSAIPIDIGQENLMVRHGGYDIRGVRADRNVAFPIDRLREFETESAIGEILPHAYSFVGAAAQLLIKNHSGPKWVEMLKSQDVEAALLVPV